ncbi:MAG: glucokinase [Marinosulfonomonas sp.]|nr:glucokinase [Marinosulfonomonas sp.]
MSKHPADTYALVADIGGTNTRVALAQGRRILPETVQKYANTDFDGLETVLRSYIAQEGDVDCAAVCVAVAGPVRDGVGALTNLDWTIDEATLAHAARAQKVAILNDLQAQGYGLGSIDPGNIRSILAGAAAQNNAPQLVIGIGTGANAAPVIETSHGRMVMPSECGHANLPIRTEADLRLCQYVETTHGFPGVDDVLSGRGLERVYRWLGLEAGDEVAKSAADIMAGMENCNDPRAVETVRIFVRIMGTFIGNQALIHLPFGGIYLIGGVARAMAPHLNDFGFRAAFCDKGRFGEFMDSFPVAVIEDDYAALVGCASYLATTE